MTTEWYIKRQAMRMRVLKKEALRLIKEDFNGTAPSMSALSQAFRYGRGYKTIKPVLAELIAIRGSISPSGFDVLPGGALGSRVPQNA